MWWANDGSAQIEVGRHLDPAETLFYDVVVLPLLQHCVVFRL